MRSASHMAPGGDVAVRIAWGSDGRPLAIGSMEILDIHKTMAYAAGSFVGKVVLTFRELRVTATSRSGCDCCCFRIS